MPQLPRKLPRKRFKTGEYIKRTRTGGTVPPDRIRVQLIKVKGSTGSEDETFWKLMTVHEYKDRLDPQFDGDSS
jgi:hypothetical protein